MNNESAKKALNILSYIREECLKEKPGTLWARKVTFGTDAFNAATVYLEEDKEHDHYHFGNKEGTLDAWIDSLHRILFD